MRDPTRLVDEPEGGLATALLRAGRTDLPPAGSLARTALALGASTSALTLSTAARGALGARHVVSGTRLGLTIAKWLGIGAVSGVVASGGARYATDPAFRAVFSMRPHAEKRVDGPTRGVLVQSVAEPTGADETPPSAASTTLPDSVEPARDTPPTPPNVATRERPRSAERAAARATPAIAAAPAANTLPVASEAPPAPEAPSAPAPSLATETELLRQARRSLAARWPSEVLAALDVYDHSTRTHVLDSEAQMLRVQALEQTGNGAAARALAARLLAADPNGAHAARLREIVGAP